MNYPTLSISADLKNALPNLVLGVVYAPVMVTTHDDALWQEIDAKIASMTSTMTIETMSAKPEIVAVRDAYRSLGKDASRYRGSAEALARRILQGKGLYKINTIVDLNNLVSLETLHPVGSYDLDRLTPPIVFRVGASGESYKGIGKEMINIESLPVFADEQGPYGGPTSDSERAMIGGNTRHLMLVIISFTGSTGLQSALDRASVLLARYASAPAADITTFIVS